MTTLTLSFPDWSISATGRTLQEASNKILVHLVRPETFETVNHEPLNP